MKKKLAIFALCIVALACLFGLAACGGNGESGGGNGGETPSHTHSYSSEWTYNDAQHWHECICGDKEGISAHVWNSGVTTTAATCTADGVKTFTCTVCDKIKTEKIAATGHTMIHTAAVSATCTENGNKEYWQCSVCEKYFSDENGNTEITLASTVIETTGHKYSAEWTFDETNHWHECDCGDKEDISAHVWNNGVTTTAATCTADGVKTFTCTICDKTKTEIIEATGHTMTHTAAVSATCTKNGNTEYWYCTVCEKYFSDKNGVAEITLASTVIETTGHTYSTEWTFDEINHWHECTCGDKEGISAHVWNNGVTTTAATCTADGEKTFTCTVCDQTKTEIIAATGHTFSAEWTYDDAQHWHECDCGDKEGIFAHVWNSGVTTTAATCTADGVKTFTCTVCDQTKTETISATGHTYSAEWTFDETNHWHECTVNGCSGKSNEAQHDFTNGDCVCGKEHPHIYSTEWTFDETSHWHECDCGDKEDNSAHLWNSGVTTTAATCTADGVKTFTCTVCDQTKTEKIAATGHTMEHTIAASATCTENGNTEYWQCSVCEKYFSDENGVAEITLASTILAATGHTMTHTAAASVTCTENGNKEYWQCSVCEKYFSDENGNTEITLASTIIEATGHTYSTEWTFDEINHWHECDCGDKEGISAHVWNNGVTTTAATCTADGMKTFTCTVCDKTKTEIIEATGHTYSTEWTFDEINHWHECDCGDKEDNSAHLWNSGITTTAATCTADGVKTFTCTVCDKTKTELISATGHKYSTEWTFDETNHWHECTVDGCSGKSDEAQHDFTNGDCVCGFNGVTFELQESGTAYTLKKVSEEKTAVVIPSKHNGLPVTSIGEWAFNGCHSLTSVTIPNSVTSFGEWAFNGCRSLTSITIPNSVTSIGDYAFYGCSGLTSITIPDSITSIGKLAFERCSGLEKVEISDIGAWCQIAFNHYYSNPLYYAKHLYMNGTEITELVIPDGVTSICDYAFSGCSSLTSITIPNDVTSIGKYAFHYCSSLTSITIPDSVTSISSSAFSHCSSLTSIKIPNDVTSIGIYAFYKCSGLTSITIPDSVTSIGSNAFRYCSGLTSITIPDSVTSIGNWAFEGCTSIEELTCPAFAVSHIPQGSLKTVVITSGTSIGESAFSGCSSLTSVTIPNSVTTIGDYAFYECTSLTSITIPDSVSSIGMLAFNGCSGLEKVEISDIGAWCQIAFNHYYSNPLYYAKHLYMNGTEITELVIPDGVTSIGDYAFYNCSGLTSITIPDSVTSIGDYAFDGCSSLTSITIPDSVTSIGRSAFHYCSSLTSITIPDNVTSIGEWAFYNCSSLTSVVIGNSVTSIGDRAFYNGSSITSIVVNEGNTNYHSSGNCLIETTTKTLILGCQTSVIPDDGSVTLIGYRAFLGCSGLTSITIPDSVTSISSSAFSGCSGLTSITIPDSVTSIGDYAFNNCSSLTSITIPDGVTSIGDWAFYECTSLTSVVIGNSVISIGNYAFSYCSSLTSITIPDSVTSIGDYAFFKCSGLTSITIPDGVTTIGNWAFSGCSSLTSITIPDGVTSIGNWAFSGCSSLTSITFDGTVEQWNKISKGSDWNLDTGNYTITCSNGTIKK